MGGGTGAILGQLGQVVFTWMVTGMGETCELQESPVSVPDSLSHGLVSLLQTGTTEGRRDKF